MRGFLMAGFALFCSGFFLSCNLIQGSGVKTFVEEPFPDNLSEWRLFVEGGASLKPNEKVIPYDLNTPLFSDYAEKHRVVWMPEGTSATYSENEPFDFPVGTVIAKTFAFPRQENDGNEKLVETRLLVRAKSGWVALPYIWNEEQTDARLEVVGGTRDVPVKNSAGVWEKIRYNIPNTNECAQCHAQSKIMLPIGPKARNLNRHYSYSTGSENQLAYWTKIGYLSGAPAPEKAPRAAVWNDPTTGSLNDRARAYLDNNCAHCHQASGSAGYTGFLLDLNEQNVRRLGYCKNPNSAGFSGDLLYDLVPGKPDESILIYRMLSTRPKEMMPEIGRSMTHPEGIELIRKWVDSLEGKCDWEVESRK